MPTRILNELLRTIAGGGADPTLDAEARLRVIANSNSFLRVFMDTWLVLGSVLLAYAWVLAPEALYFPVSLLCCGTAARLALGWRRPVLARLLLIVPMGLLIAAVPLFLNGVRTPILANVPLLLMLAGWMLGRRAMLLMATGYAIELLVLWQIEALGVWTMPAPLRSPDVWLMVWMFDFLFSAVIVAVLIGNYQADFRREATLQRRLADVLHYAESLLRHSPLPMRVFDAAGRCTRVNEAWSRLVGVPREELLAQTLDQLAASGFADLVAASRATLGSLQPMRREEHFTSRDGRELWLELHVLPFDGEDGRSLLLQLVDLTERKRHASDLETLAFHDPLTRLPNRRLFMQRLEHALHSHRRNGRWGGVLLLDLDRFKELNDRCGHACGDRLLVEVAERLRATLRGTDTPARLGGDEFVVLAEELGGTREEAQARLDQLRHKLGAVLEQPYELGPVRHGSTASIGATLFGADAAQAPEAVIRAADEAMYACKRRARPVD